MKKFLSLLLIASLSVALVGCKTDVKEDVYDESLSNADLVEEAEMNQEEVTGEEVTAESVEEVTADLD